MKQIPFNTTSDGTTYAIKGNYARTSFANLQGWRFGSTGVLVISDLEEQAEWVGV